MTVTRSIVGVLVALGFVCLSLGCASGKKSCCGTDACKCEKKAETNAAAADAHAGHTAEAAAPPAPAASAEPAPAAAGEKVLFADDFENGLGKWTGRYGDESSAQIVPDPLNDKNKVVTFTRTVSEGDLYSPPIPVVEGRKYFLAFDYLGLKQPDSTEGNHGGFVGWFDSSWDNSNHGWIAGTDLSETTNKIPDDGKWSSHRVAFDPFSLFPPTGDRIRIMLEDWEGAFGVAGDCYFDNIRLIEVAEPK